MVDVVERLPSLTPTKGVVGWCNDAGETSSVGATN